MKFLSLCVHEVLLLPRLSYVRKIWGSGTEPQCQFAETWGTDRETGTIAACGGAKTLSVNDCPQ